MARPGRPAIRSYSTRCLLLWQVEPSRGRIGYCLFLLCGASALFALLCLPFAIWTRLLLATCLLLLLAAQLITTCRRGRLHLIHAHDGWSCRHRHAGSGVSGTLVQAGYRSAWLVIVTIQSEDTALHRFAIWQDQLSARDFSYLHQQLAFAAVAPVRRTTAAWFKGLIY